MKVATVIGARPQFIKAAALSRVLKQRGEDEILIHTGQHYDKNMSDVFFEELEIPAPKYHLGIGSGSHGQQTGAMLGAIEEVLVNEKPDWLIVYGDTNSTVAGALAASKIHLKVAHVEAGLRSFNRKMPEEVNRVVTDHLSDLLFAPTQTAVGHLKHEGRPESAIHLVGDVMYDAALYFKEKSAQTESEVFAKLGIERGGYVMATIHRAENTDDPKQLKAIFDAFRKLSKTAQVVLPLHPRTRKQLEVFDVSTEGIKLIDPVGFLEMTTLVSNASLVVTDSGGLQKEAYFHGVRCCTLRTETEWTELVDAGCNTLTPSWEPDQIFAFFSESLEKAFPSDIAPLYGKGDASEKIADLLAV
ncbi:UNVERIFIED_CONTAM: hypothetical protein GTU68_004626 [Idotea baltica]|nr:hypothetical protein [Idotea baltica]